MKNLKTNTVKKVFNDFGGSVILNTMTKVRAFPAEEVVGFHFGQSPFPVYPPIAHGLKNHINSNGYAHKNGVVELREQMSKWIKHHHGLDYSPDNIIVTTGAKINFFTLMKILSGQVMINACSWATYAPQNVIANFEKPTIVQSTKENNYFPTPEDFRRAENSDQNRKLTIINSPNNPSGLVIPQNLQKELADYFRKNGYILVDDEIYNLLHFDMNDYVPFAKLYPEGTILSNSVSKWGNAGGWRIGYMAFPDELKFLIDHILALNTEIVSCPATPLQYAAIDMFKVGDKEYDRYINDMRRICKVTGVYIAKRLRELGLSCKDPQGGFYMYVDFEDFRGKLAGKGITTGKQLTDALLDRHKIAVLDGSCFLRDPNELGFRLSNSDYNGKLLLEKARLIDTELDDNFVEENCDKIIRGVEGIKSFVNWLNE